jgi:biopolymer transport protein ExbD
MAPARLRQRSLFLGLGIFAMLAKSGCGGAVREEASVTPEPTAATQTEAPKPSAPREPAPKASAPPMLFLTAGGALTLDDTPLRSPEELAKLLPERIAIRQREHPREVIDPREHGVGLRADRAASRGRVLETLRLCSLAGLRKVRLLTKIQDGPDAPQRMFLLHLASSGTVVLGQPAEPLPETGKAPDPLEALLEIDFRITIRIVPPVDKKQRGAVGGFVVESEAFRYGIGENQPAKLAAFLETQHKQMGGGAEKAEVRIDAERDLPLAAFLEIVDLVHKVGFARIVLFDADAGKNMKLSNDDIGNDPELNMKYNNDPIPDVIVPGPTNPKQAQDVIAGLEDGAGRPADVRSLLNLLAGRSGATREKMLREGGGNIRSEAAVAAGLKWLARHQAADGHWGLHDFHVAGHCNCGNPGRENDGTGTGLALLAFLGAGETHKGGGIYAKKVHNALLWIVQRQAADGTLGDDLAHAICTICICEAYGLTADPNLRVPARRALDRLVKTRNKSGLWEGLPDAAPTAATGVWQIAALRSGQLAQLHVPQENWEPARKSLDESLTADLQRKEPASAVLAARLLAVQNAGEDVKSPLLAKGVEAVSKSLPDTDRKDLEYYFFATSVMHNQGGEGWTGWNARMRDLLVEAQDQGQGPGRADQKGSWSPVGDGLAESGGRLTETALAVLTLEVYYRHLPLHRRDRKADEPAKP